MSSLPPIKVGDRVTFVNDQGCVFPGKTIVKIQPEPENGGRDYFYTPSDSPWFGSRRDQLHLEPQASENVPGAGTIEPKDGVAPRLLSTRSTFQSSKGRHDQAPD